MALQTVLVLRADAQKLRTLFELPETSTAFTSTGATPELSVKLLDDGALVRTRHAFGIEPEELLAALRSEMARALALHDDPRGLFVYPSVAQVTAHDVEGIVGEVGAGGEWLAHQAKRDTMPPSPIARRSPSVSELLDGGSSRGAAAGMPDLSAMLGGFGAPDGGLPDLGALAEQMGFALPEGAAEQVAAMLQGEGGAALLQAASQIARSLSGEDLSRLASGDMGAVAAKAEGLAAQLGLAAPPSDAAAATDADGEDED